MALSTTAKVASGVATASTVTVGTVVTYKYFSLSLFKPEKDAIENGSWTVKTKSSSNTTTKTFEVIVKAQSEKWTCTLIASASDTTKVPVLTDLDIQNNLKNYFPGIEVKDAETTYTNTAIPDKSNREGFVTSCSRNRKTRPTPSDNVVNSVLKLTLTKQGGDKYKFSSEDLSSVFSGKWVNSPVDLYAIEKLAMDATSWKVKQENNSQTFSVSVKAEANKNLTSEYGVESNGSWTCTLTTSDSDSANTLKEKLKTELNLSKAIDTSEQEFTFSDKAKKESLVNSCSRNRKFDQTQSKDTVTAELKISKDDIDGDLKTVFEGVFDNKSE